MKSTTLSKPQPNTNFVTLELEGSADRVCSEHEHPALYELTVIQSVIKRGNREIIAVGVAILWHTYIYTV